MGLAKDIIGAAFGGPFAGPLGRGISAAMQHKRKKRGGAVGDVDEPMSIGYDTGSDSDTEMMYPRRPKRSNGKANGR